MRSLAAAFALLASAAFAPADAAARQRPISKDEVRTAPPEQTHRRLRDQLWSLIRREDLRRERAPRQMLRRLHTSTRPRGTEIPGLCRSDALVIEFHPVGRTGRGAETRVRASGFTATSRFRFLRPPTAPGDRLADYRRLPEDEPGCAALDEASFFEAADAEVAADGWFAFLELQRALRDNRALPLDCNLHRVEELPDCRAIILALGQDDLLEVERCDSLPDGRWCTRLHIDDRRIDLYTSAGAHGPFGSVTAAKLVSMIVMSHEVID